MQILGFCIALFFLAAAHSDSNTVQPERCANGSPRCSNQESPVWTTSDGLSCKVFRNPCLLLTKNCELERENKPKYRKITKTKCQELCNNTMCLQVYDPVCGLYNGKFKTFGNNCQMDIYICKTGETYSLHREGECPK